jgi:GxxExxY protein
MLRRPILHEATTRGVIGAFFEVYNTLGFGFLEHVYVMALERELREMGHRIAREVWVPVFYKGDELARHRLDMLVDDRVLVEIKSTLDLHPAAKRQIHNYLAATKLEVGLLLHFGPEAKFHRLYRPASWNPRAAAIDPTNPDNPDDPSSPLRS